MIKTHELSTSSNEASLDLLEILRILKRNWLLLAVLPFAVALFVGVVAKILVRPSYVSRATILSTQGDSSLGSLSGGISQLLGRGGAANGQLSQFERILRTRALAGKVATRMRSATEGEDLGFTIKADPLTLELEYRSNNAIRSSEGVKAYLDTLSEFVQETSTAKSKANESFIHARLQEATASISDLEKKIPQMRLSEANRELQIQSKIVMLLREQYELAQIETKKEQQNFQLIDPPNVPTAPETAPVSKYMIVSFFLSAFLGALFTVVYSLYRDEVRRRSIGVAKN